MRYSSRIDHRLDRRRGITSDIPQAQAGSRSSQEELSTVQFRDIMRAMIVNNLTAGE